ncbi:SnoaL-like domain-containing protein [Gordonia sp. TBRC 11910]|uniref:SnoaL-like domain-containing protein n=1 Tax=Gordonia asplenii TaxID=2725283 RepID=A0A848KUS9_9ACTN|nr:nuclear transport factor 2 family protein [Gordonia asplenii]NMO02634.1 SnoaL-like domain-containing protein [Gordonia asplenii]
MSTIDQLRVAVEERDLEALDALFADDARVFSPMKFSPFTGRPVIKTLFGVLLTKVFDDFRYVGELAGTCEMADGERAPTHALVLRASVGERQIHGIDLVQLNEQGLIEEFTIMLRPRSGLDAVAERVNAGLIELGVLAPR